MKKADCKNCQNSKITPVIISQGGIKGKEIQEKLDCKEGYLVDNKSCNGFKASINQS